MTYIDSFLNGITMYRLVMYGLALLALIATVFGFFGLLPNTGVEYIVSFFFLTFICFGANALCALLYKAPANSESSYITAFILFFLLEPSISFVGLAWMCVAGVIAILSKYVVAYHNKHIFNPAAFGVFALQLAGSGAVLWWIATPILLIPVTILGLLVVRKIRRFHMFSTFFVASILVAIGYALQGGYDVSQTCKQLLLSWPLLFFASIMLTEPSTTPPTFRLRLVYGVLVGALFSAQFAWGPLHATPQLALIVGNIFAFFVSSKEKLMLKLQSIQDLGAGFYEFVFVADHSLLFRPGQYLEWTINPAGADLRGNRRYLSLASAPGNTEVRFATRMPKVKPSSFKSKLLEMKPGEVIAAGGLAGDFTLPENTAEKLVFIAGGIGVTPFISQMRDLLMRNEKRDITLFYAVSAESDVVFTDVLEQAQDRGVKVIKVIGSFITEEMIKREVPDYVSRRFYISGPNAMVESYRKLLRRLHIASARITTDYFPGL